MMLDASRSYDQPLSDERLFAWHAALFPTGRSGIKKLRVGAWRDDSTGPMQVVSGPIGKEHIHFEAVPAARIREEMSVFLDWFNRPADIDEVLKAGLAHIWFVNIHPFDAGNGRIARATKGISARACIRAFSATHSHCRMPALPEDPLGANRCPCNAGICARAHCRGRYMKSPRLVLRVEVPPGAQSKSGVLIAWFPLFPLVGAAAGPSYFPSRTAKMFT
jgi:hypothetical protein